MAKGKARWTYNCDMNYVEEKVYLKFRNKQDSW